MGGKHLRQIGVARAASHAKVRVRRRGVGGEVRDRNLVDFNHDLSV
ncbi:MAG: hypothetical protein JOZ41_14060 [Chloroflexi bacterium]|nr:hypothetical protein [Chloroflexota bacterium]